MILGSVLHQLFIASLQICDFEVVSIGPLICNDSKNLRQKIKGQFDKVN